MATIDLKLSSKKDKISGKSEILLRFHQGKDMDFRVKTNIYILPKHFRYYINRSASIKAGAKVPDKANLATKEEAKAKGYVLRTSGEIVIADRIITDEVKEEQDTAKRVKDLMTYISDSFSRIPKEEITAQWLEKLINTFNHPEKEVQTEDEFKLNSQMSIYMLAETYLKRKKFSYDHTKAFKVLIRDLARYEAYKNKVRHEKFKWNIHGMTRHDIEDFEIYLRTEKSLAEKYPKQFEDILEKYPVEIHVVHKNAKLHNRGDNTIIKLKKKFKAFMQWLYDMELTKNKPFDGIKIGTEKYGLPYYLWKGERNDIATANLEERWELLSDEEKKEIPKARLASLGIQRDIFVFQCLVGCRVGDLYRLTSKNITNGILEYVPSKTMDEDAPVRPRIPLSKTALALVKKYKGVDPEGRLFPFISSDKYNDAIKEILIVCGITRNVQIRNSLTGETEIKRICDVASSHMARRTFVGAAYKVVKDPNIVGKMSGHVEGSRAFNRYRQIDDDILRETIREM